ncbi:SCO2322 family protein [Streptomyces sp. NBC_00566]|uniref:SCO2322 family protein n=1 Tax=Streptomyces sp. NBC_00566 TaxID=2975778 RepID=UPI002E8088A1|nr:SCO2322 family protein [Streptomyces sp. NBC_00566]WUB88975.1 SCO2322 family protein [Streptomyces sp. NBC_00566]
MTSVRRAAALLVASLLVLAAAAQAQAAGYRYWSFWDRSGGRWTYATQGPAMERPDDGAVQGFRFAVSADSSDANRPRGTADFGTICAGTPAKAGTKRVALVLDFGTRADAPSGENPPAERKVCARVSPDATTADALAEAAKPLRYDSNALLCAIAGYPARGCGEQVSADGKNADEKTTGKRAAPEDDGPSLGLPLGIGVVAVLGGAAFWQARRRRNA